MTKEDFYAKYGDVKVKFYRYYKYTFTYKATLEDGSILFCGVGGNAEDIYREEVCADQEQPLSTLFPYEGGITKDGKEIESFYDY